MDAVDSIHAQLDALESTRAPATASPEEKRHSVPGLLTEEQWDEFYSRGFVNLGKVIPDDLMERMRVRIHDIMMGEARPTAPVLDQSQPCCVVTSLPLGPVR